ncbi:DUF2637 domain-containing protein [Streptomyces rimosus]|uniref:DUF2637 domain-containing protein n=1 Tax=Streptomyces TaxID=1883 RepID=UPI0004C6A7CA|nr:MULTISPECIES: DUF2637 domain-containing protein [Streptomyces]
MYDPPTLHLLMPSTADGYRIPAQVTTEPDLTAAFGLADGPLFRDQPAHESLADAYGHDAPMRVPDDLDAELAQLLDTAEQPAVVEELPADGPHSHRKPTLLHPARAAKEGGTRSWRRTLSVVTVALTSVIVVAVGLLAAVASYPPLRALAGEATSPRIAQLWPLLVYGPWMAAILSILRARTHRRRTAHSWCVVIFFAAVATVLCIAKAPTTPAGITVAGLPPVTALLCFHQLIRQLEPGPSVTPATRHAYSNRGAHRHRSGR